MEPLEHSATNGSSKNNNKNDETSDYDCEAEEESEAERGLLGSLERRRVSVTTAAGDVWPAAAGPDERPPLPAVSSTQLHRVLQSSGAGAAALSSSTKETTTNTKHDSSSASSAEVTRSPSQQTLRNIAKKVMTLSSRRLSSPRSTPVPPPPNDVERVDIGSGFLSDRGPNNLATLRHFPFHAENPPSATNSSKTSQNAQQSLCATGTLVRNQQQQQPVVYQQSSVYNYNDDRWLTSTKARTHKGYFASRCSHRKDIKQR